MKGEAGMRGPIGLSGRKGLPVSSELNSVGKIFIACLKL